MEMTARVYRVPAREQPLRICHQTDGFCAEFRERRFADTGERHVGISDNRGSVPECFHSQTDRVRGKAKCAHIVKISGRMDHTLDNGRNVVGQNEIAELACDGSEALLSMFSGRVTKPPVF